MSTQAIRAGLTVASEYNSRLPLAKMAEKAVSKLNIPLLFIQDSWPRIDSVMPHSHGKSLTIWVLRLCESNAFPKFTISIL